MTLKVGDRLKQKALMYVLLGLKNAYYVTIINIFKIQYVFKLSYDRMYNCYDIVQS